ncbi:MAG: hypothetical protein COZ75_02225 [Flavobacteriaceae bacterium CG_4_8_14_3_um_filter_34_10]|nr:MAG: hypothetical protein COW66_06970 [Flavobacteriaceae bacterium CG18_big_fil_WC_8_21_14_2_50_34_36]PIV50651.1 MAG: hypothetical protein COS19_03740 [Flavobacteriaceae bacterium CG02_land_8_20_14_3_00_34_13]PIX10324.1 MAG: hypothetical protein COZ75_02225 [Flavobacteriaceae bacterium CG_4_8_14_3_um_filter_34_10]PIZ08167.1 MAG: hypothetical protein COY56_05325 [Flavobacteriaceae bacterium CG_4_10_14_0_8_um_filter_34_31]PJC06378.1 MAG: hypothetical protein CO068_11535 [Flavobacteriaceae bact
MKKLFFLLILLPLFSFSQIAEFETNYSIGNGYTMEMQMKWELYENKLIGYFTDRKIVKMMEKQNQPTTQVYELEMFEKDPEAKFKQDIHGNYIYQTETIRIIVTIGQLIKMTTKDDFSGQVNDVSYVYIDM